MNLASAWPRFTIGKRSIRGIQASDVKRLKDLQAKLSQYKTNVRRGELQATGSAKPDCKKVIRSAEKKHLVRVLKNED